MKTKTNKYGYTSLAILPGDKDNFTKLNIDWNIKNPTKRKRKSEFFILLINIFKKYIKDQK